MEQANSEQPSDSTVLSTTRRELIERCSLVLSAKSISHQIRNGINGNTQITVSADDAEKARYQLHKYIEENKNWPPPQIEVRHPSFPSFLPTVLLIASLAWFHMVTGPWHPSSIWFAAGANDATAVIDGGQWFRLLTSLTLHADFSHLAGNCLIGGLLVYFFLQIQGIGLGLAAILLSGVLGNAINVAAHGGNHLSVGFSTAVFAIIGMLSMYQLIEQRQPLGIRFFIPLMAGAGLLAMLGSSGVRTDLGSHFFGLLSGLGFGLLLAIKPIKQMRHLPFLQIFLLIVVVIVIMSSWRQALDGAIY